MKTLYGAHRPDEGTIAVDGVLHDFKSPRDAIDVGIGMVFQHFMLADNLRVWENIVIGDEPTAGRRVARRSQGGQPPARAVQAVRPRRRPDRAGRRSRRRREAAHRDPEGDLPRRADPHPRRADGGARAAGGRRTVRLAALAHRVGVHGDLHLPQARRGAQARRRDHGHPRRQDRGRGAGPDAGQRPSAGRDDGRQRAAHARDARIDGHRQGRAVRRGADRQPMVGATCSTTSASTCTPARSSASPASRATARPS